MTYGTGRPGFTYGSSPYGAEGGLTITSPYGSPIGGGFGFLGRGFFSSEETIPRLGINTDEQYFEYYFNLTTLGAQTTEDNCQQYSPVKINVTGDEQYYTLWICDSFTERVAVRNPAGEFKPGETVTGANGATATVKDWHRYNESNALHIIEFEEGTASGGFPGHNVTGSSSGATAECISGYNDVEAQSSIGLSFLGVPTFVASQVPLIGTISGFYTYPKKVGYTKYLPPKCDVLLDVCEDVTEYIDQLDGWTKSYGKDSPIDCELKPFMKAVSDQHTDTWGTKENMCSRQSTRANSVNSGVFKAVALLGTDATLENAVFTPITFRGLAEANLDSGYAAVATGGEPKMLDQSGTAIRLLDNDGDDANASFFIRTVYGGSAKFAFDPNREARGSGGLNLAIATEGRVEIELELQWDDNPDTAQTALGTIEIAGETWTQKGESGTQTKTIIIGEEIGGEGLPLKNKRNRCVEKGLKDGFEGYFEAIKDFVICDVPLDKDKFKIDTRGLSKSAEIDNNYKEIIECVEDEEDIGNKKLEPNYNDSGDMFKESKTFFCEIGDAFDYAIAAQDYMDLAFNDMKTVVPTVSYVEIAQEMYTHGFRSVPPPSERLKWSIFRYDPHRTGERVLPITITGIWVCTTPSYTQTTTNPAVPPDPNVPGDTGTPESETTTTVGNPSFGGAFSKTFNTDLTIESDWSTHRDNLIAAVDAQGNPDNNTLMAQLSEFMNTEESELRVVDFDTADLPEYGYIEMNNYDIEGKGVEEVRPINIGLGYMNTPNVSFNAPDLEDGRAPTVEAIVTQGRVTSINIINPGKGYVQEPVVTIDLPNPEITGTGDITANSRFIQNVGFAEMDFYEKLFVGVRISLDGGAMSYNEVLRLIPGVAMNITADGTAVVTVTEILFNAEIEDVAPGLRVEGVKGSGGGVISIAAIDINNNQITMTDAVDAGTYSINTERTILMTYESDTTQAGASLTFSAPSVVPATAIARLFVGEDRGTAFNYANSREIAHYDGKQSMNDGSTKLLNIQRGRKETTIAQHLRGDHTLLHTRI